ncbi:ATPase [Microbacterium dextranolyticum]|uniref:Uncharacterized protein n=1 Tax=Microbacterium dextranolyticum TaxID=36806 RepID=A0A9W6HJC4_9MICO|nr:ATPase [Microbacterium dextranolyticum]MBM7462096.1 signal transduction histidine kinase [Microbacterium dextranolyticum]GLJ94340.1 hypothetical protein GCM10017591_04010 [Microbacterium dextranolyticum]
MNRGPWHAATVLTAYGEAAVSGRFFTRWSALVSLLVAVTMLTPVLPGGTAGYAQGMLGSFAAWCALAVPVLIVAALERRLETRSVRGILVTATMIAVAIARPFANDAALHLLFGRGSHGDIVARVSTNLVVVVLLFSLVGVITTQYQRASDSIERLDAALERLSEARRAFEDERRAAHELVHTEVADLRAARDEMLAGTIDFDAVRDYSDLVRAASHRLEALADAPAGALDPAASRAASVALSASASVSTAVQAPAPKPRIVRALRPTPMLLVGAIYLLTCAPFLVSTGDLMVVALAIISSAAMDAVVTLILRAAGPDGRVPLAGFIATWLAGGAFASLVAAWLAPDLGALLLLVPLVAVPASAVVVGFAIDASRRARDEENASTAALAGAAGALAALRTGTGAPLQHAASTLHGRVQGRCVIFAALIDDAPPTGAQIDGFRDQTDLAFDDVLRAGRAADAACTGDLDRVIDGWQPLLHLDTRIDPALTTAIARSGVAPLVGDIVNEALVNAVKHSGARAARIEIVHVDDDVHVRVASAGQLPRPLVPTRHFGSRTRLYQDGPDVVLEAVVSAAGALTRQV